MAKSHQHEQSRKDKFLESFSQFLYKNRIILITVFSVIIAGLIALSVIVSINRSNAEKAAGRTEQLQETYSEWLQMSDEDEEGTGKKAELKETILTDAQDIADSFPKTFAAQRSIFIAAELNSIEEEWEESAEGYARLAEGYPESYLAPLALAAASAAYENAGIPEKALESARGIVDDYGDTSLEAPHAWFTVGRLLEQSGDSNGALEAYRELVGNFPESSWTKLAQDRIIVLEKGE